MVNFKQVLRVEKIIDWHTQFEGFGITLEDIALTWSQYIGIDTCFKLKTMEKYFIEYLSKIGIKHNTMTLIYNFIQFSIENV